ncbi:MAG: hypothetical protein ACK5T7_03875, partial [Gemmatimonas sp.]
MTRMTRMTRMRAVLALLGSLALAAACAPGARAPAPAWDATGGTLVVPPGLTGRTTLRGVLIDSLVTNDTLR